MLFCFLFSHGLVIKSPQWHFMPMVNETRGDYPVVGHYSHLVHGQRSANGGELPNRTTCTGVQNGDGGEGHRIDNYGVPVVEEGQLFLRMRVVFFLLFVLLSSLLAVVAIRLVFVAGPTWRIRKPYTKSSIRHGYVI